MKGLIPVCKACGKIKRFGKWDYISINQSRKVKRYGVKPTLCPSCEAIRISLAKLKVRHSFQYADPIEAQAE